MRLEGSCHCGRVAFGFESEWVRPLMYCYCGRCRKTTGSPVVVWLKGLKEGFKLSRGGEHVRRYSVEESHRHFCAACGSSLFLTDDRWPDKVWPNAAAVDSQIPAAGEIVHIYVASKAPWFPILAPGPQFDGDSDLSFEEYHAQWGFLGGGAAAAPAPAPAPAGTAGTAPAGESGPAAG